MAPKKADLYQDLITDLREITAKLPSSIDGTKSPAAAKRARAEVEAIAHDLHNLVAKLDPVKRPASVFDPSNPAIVGRVIAMTLVAQDRVKLRELDPFYGSGVYAIYYRGSFPAYKPLAGAEHPIYVGKADPAHDQARDAIAQGSKLFDRLNEHARSIAKADKSLELDDFDCRFLIVSSGWQKAAEDYLIRLFRPIWNTEVKIAFGIGKHGDSATTRANLRSPWDTLHPGRAWADATTADQKPLPTIKAEIAAHLKREPPYATKEELFTRFMDDMRQLPRVLEEGGESPLPNDS